MFASGLARQLSLMLACALLTLALPLRAAAQTGLNLDPTQGPPGTEVRVSGDGFSPDAELAIWFAGNGEVAQSTADGAGAFATTFTVPPDATVGGHAVSVEAPGMSGAAVATFEVTGPPADEQQQASIALVPTEGPPGTTVTVTGSGFTANDTVFLFFAISGNEVAQTTSDATGAFQTTFPVPSDATAGDNTIIAGEVDPTYLADAIFRVTGGAGPSPGEGPQPADGAITVDSTKAGWQETPLSMQQGQTGRISYGAGTWSVDYRNFPYVGPDGYDSATDSKIYQGCKLDASLPYGRLLGKVGDGAFFSVGKGGDFTANAAGTLSLKIHDDDACLGDNAGSIGVDVEQTADPKPREVPQPQTLCGEVKQATPAGAPPNLTTFRPVFVPSDGSPVALWDPPSAFSFNAFYRIRDARIDPVSPPFDSQEYGAIGHELVSWSAYEPIASPEACGAVAPDEPVLDDFAYPLDLPPGTTLLVDYNVVGKRNDTARCYSTPEQPVGLNESLHAGEDHKAPANTPVKAVAAGVVYYVSPASYSYNPGGVVIIDHTLRDGSHIYSMYGHLDTGPTYPGKLRVSKGAQVEKGTTLADGLAPQTFNGTDNTHLHWELRFFDDGSGIKSKSTGYTASCSGTAGPGYTSQMALLTL